MQFVPLHLQYKYHCGQSVSATLYSANGGATLNQTKTLEQKMGPPGVFHEVSES